MRPRAASPNTNEDVKGGLEHSTERWTKGVGYRYHPAPMLKKLAFYDTVFARWALGVGFLSAVADRFGIWGAAGAPNVAWGDFASFSAYAAKLNPWASEALMPVVAWTATIAEIALGVLLIVGFQTRRAAFASGVLLLLFALGMTVGTGIKSAFDASVFAASALGFLLSARTSFPLSLDGS